MNIKDFLFFSIILFLIIFIPPIVLGTSSYPIAVVEGNSMYPTYKRGDLIIYKYISPNEIKPGMIIVFKFAKSSMPFLSSLSGQVIAHRVVEVVQQDGKCYFKTKGDNNPFPDLTLVSQDYVLGTPLIVIPYAGHLILFFRSIYGLVFISAIILYLPIIYMEIEAIRKKSLMLKLVQAKLDGILNNEEFEHLKLFIELNGEIVLCSKYNKKFNALLDFLKKEKLNIKIEYENRSIPSLIFKSKKSILIYNPNN